MVKNIIFAGKTKTATAVGIFWVLCFFTFITSAYGYLFFGVKELLVRAAIGLFAVCVHVFFERIRIRAGIAAFLMPSCFMTAVFSGAVYSGDVLIFIYVIGASMLSLTYLKPKSILVYMAYCFGLSIIILFGFQINLMGDPYSIVHNMIFLILSMVLSFIVYLFCRSYIAMINNLIKAENKAAMAAKAKGNFLSNMSHEIRTPMNAIIGMTKIGISAASMERMAYCLNRIDDASHHLLGIINDILDVSKIESGKFTLAPVEFDFETLLKRIINVISLRVDEKEQKFSVYVDRLIPKNLIGDDQRLAQVITNLLSNAVKFAPEHGSVSVKTYFLGEKDGLCEIKIAVIDTGIGISGEQQSKLFQSFQQAESDTTRKYGGTGLGLAISKSIVEMMGGEIWIDSELGRGTTFTFTIRMERGKETVQKEQGIDWQNVRILAAGHEQYIVQDLKGIVEKTGARCDIAANGEDALKLLEHNGNYDLFFVDWKMPGMNGIELAEKIKEKKSMQDSSFVLMTSTADYNKIAGIAEEAGVDKIMVKPLFPSTIAEIAGEYFGLEKIQVEKGAVNIDKIFEGHNILLAEDIAINREIVLALFEPTLLGIDCAVNGKDAVKKFSEAPDQYEMIFMDIQMPEMDGYDAAKAIRALDCVKAKTIPIIAMTANVFKEDIEKCLAAGMNDHVGKPIDFDEVLDILRTYLIKYPAAEQYC